MTFPGLTVEDADILREIKAEYFWDKIPFHRLTTALDVGAHIGMWSWCCLQHAPHMQITAIEPHNDNYTRLFEAELNIQPLFGWAGYRQNVEGLCVRKGMSGSHYVLNRGQYPADGGWVVPLPDRYTLEDFGAIDLLKLDCEGSEFDILLNCKTETLDNIKVIVGEYHTEFGNMSAIVERLKAHGFRLTLAPHSLAPHLGYFLAKEAGL